MVHIYVIFIYIQQNPKKKDVIKYNLAKKINETNNYFYK